MNYLRTTLSAILMLSPLAVLHAERAEIDADYFTISETVVATHVREASNNDAIPLLPENKVPLAAAGGIINGGVAAWNIVNGGQASSHLNHTYASALPGWGDWHNITGWKGPKEVVYRMTAKNLYGMTVLDVEYVVSFFYGGKSPNGKGQYIANFTAKATKFSIKWGFKYYMDIRISDPMNVGTPENPLAYMQADVNWSISNPLKTSRGFQTYAVRGDGFFKDISPDTKEPPPPPAPIENVIVNWD